jgi:hypothetical protein
MKLILGLPQLLVVPLAMTVFAGLSFQSLARKPGRGGELPVLVLVRHADKAGQPADDPPLTAAGAKRAQDLAMALRNAGVTATARPVFAAAILVDGDHSTAIFAQGHPVPEPEQVDSTD